MFPSIGFQPEFRILWPGSLPDLEMELGHIVYRADCAYDVTRAYLVTGFHGDGVELAVE